VADKKAKRGAPAGNERAKKPEDKLRKSITVRLPRDLIEAVKQRGELTAQIEMALRALLNQGS